MLKDVEMVGGYKLYCLHKNSEYLVYVSGHTTRRAKEHLYEWAKHAHGNPPPGTAYSYYNVILPNGKRKRLVNYL